MALNDRTGTVNLSKHATMASSERLIDHRDVSDLSPEEARKLVCKLQIDQMKLRRQNEELQKALLEMETSRKELWDLYELAPVGHLTLDKRGLILKTNLTGCLLLGTYRQSMLGRPLADFVSEGARSLLCSHLQKVFETRTRQTCEIRLTGNDSSPYVQVSSQAFESFEGDFDRCRTSLTDITERKNGEEALRQAQERLLLALSGGDLGWWDWNIETDELVLNERAAKILDYSLAEFEPSFRLWRWIMHPDDAPCVLHALQEHLAGHTPLFEAEHRIRDKSGAWVWIYLCGKVVERAENGNPLRMAGIFLDTTDRRRTEQAVRENELRFRAVFEAAEECIFLKDAALRFSDVNPAFERIVGLPASEIIGKRHEDLFGDGDISACIRQEELRVLAGETIEEEQTKTVRGARMTCLATRTPLRDASGKIIGILTIAHDITDRRRIESPSPRSHKQWVSSSMKSAVALALMAAKRNITVLLLGESGSGKDHLARYLHDHSTQAHGPYFSLNCASIAPEVAESELFGHERGAFTGAVGTKRGLLELAEGGTLLLNEIGELSLPLQAKLLAFLDTRKFTRVGGEQEIFVNARIVAATNKDLEKEVREGRFRKDLFFRLKVVEIEIPPLRERVEDIPQLVEEILARLCSKLQIQPMPSINPGIMAALKRYRWPGNVRELRNVLERALILSEGRALNLEALNLRESGPVLPQDERATFTISFPSGQSIHKISHDVKRFLVSEALRLSGGSRQGASALLGVSRHSLKHYMKVLLL